MTQKNDAKWLGRIWQFWASKRTNGGFVFFGAHFGHVSPFFPQYYSIFASKLSIFPLSVVFIHLNLLLGHFWKWLKIDSKSRGCFKGLPWRGCKSWGREGSFHCTKEGPENRKNGVNLRPPLCRPLKHPMTQKCSKLTPKTKVTIESLWLFWVWGLWVTSPARWKASMKSWDLAHFACKIRRGQSTVCGPKWTKMAKMDQNGPFWSREC